jgi:hypothetical protein
MKHEMLSETQGRHVQPESHQRDIQIHSYKVNLIAGHDVV